MSSLTNKKICIISPSLKMGGIERALTVLANYFCERGHKVFFISAQGGEKFYTLRSEIDFFEPELNRKSGIIGKIKAYMRIVSFLKRKVIFIEPDVVLSFGDAFNPLVLFALRSIKVPVFISDRTSPDFKFNSIIKIGKKYLYPNAAGFIAQTKRAEQYKIKVYKNTLNIKVIPNALKNIEIHDVIRKKIILCVGRLSIEKGQDRLIDAFSKVENSDNWELQFAGTGPRLQEMKLLAKKLGIINNVKFLGIIEDVDLLLSEASIFVLPSRLEGFPNALCEAMAAGLPCICFDSIPTEAILENNLDGIIVEEGNIEKLASSIDFLMHNKLERDRLGQNALKIRNRLQVEKIGNEFLSFMFE